MGRLHGDYKPFTGTDSLAVLLRYSRDRSSDHPAEQRKVKDLVPPTYI